MWIFFYLANLIACWVLAYVAKCPTIKKTKWNDNKKVQPCITESKRPKKYKIELYSFDSCQSIMCEFFFILEFINIGSHFKQKILINIFSFLYFSFRVCHTHKCFELPLLFLSLWNWPNTCQNFDSTSSVKQKKNNRFEYLKYVR